MLLIFVGVNQGQSTNNAHDSLLLMAKLEFEKENYSGALKILETTLSQLNKAQNQDIHLYMGLSYVAIGSYAEAHEHLRIVLKLDPDFSLMSTLATPAAIKTFNAVKKEIARESAVCACFIPGIGQMLKGEDRKGKMIMLGSAMSFVSSIGLWMRTEGLRSDYLSLAPDEIDKMDEFYNGYNRWYKASLISSSIFGIIYLYSFFDAMFANTKVRIVSNSTNGFYHQLQEKEFKMGYHIGF